MTTYSEWSHKGWLPESNSIKTQNRNFVKPVSKAKLHENLSQSKALQSSMLMERRSSRTHGDPHLLNHLEERSIINSIRTCGVEKRKYTSHVINPRRMRHTASTKYGRRFSETLRSRSSAAIEVENV